MTQRRTIAVSVFWFACNGSPSTVSSTPRSSTIEAPSASVANPSLLSKPMLTKTALPSEAEWPVAEVVRVAGADELGCEAKIIREWVRVACRGATKRGSVPSSVELPAGGGSEATTSDKDGVTVVTARYLPGTKLKVRFGWVEAPSFGDSSPSFATLVLDWPSGETSMPAPIGQFDGQR